MSEFRPIKYRTLAAYETDKSDPAQIKEGDLIFIKEKNKIALYGILYGSIGELDYSALFVVALSAVKDIDIRLKRIELKLGL